MAKIFIYSIVLVTLFAIVNMAGLPTATNTILNQTSFFTPSGWSSSLLIIAISVMIGVTAAVGIGASLLGRSMSESYMITGLFIQGGILLAFVADVGSVVSYLQSFSDMAWIGNIFGLFFGAIVVGYIFAMVQYWRGNDI